MKAEIVENKTELDTSHYSVLMSVYYKEKPEFLRKSINSIFDQTIPTDDFVLVCDGLLNDDLNEVVAEMEIKFGGRLHIHRLANNGGLGNALNMGIKNCKYELVARMDSDDISRPERCECQLEIFRNHPEYSIVSGIVEEFSTDIDHVESRRVLPEKQNEILRFAQKRNPFNHPCVMYKKSSVEDAGGYLDFFLLEDYYLWIRMLQNGSIGYNIQHPLIWMRTGLDYYQRRGGWEYVKSQQRLFRYMRESGFISQGQYVAQTFIRCCASLAPNKVRKQFYQKALR